MASSELEFNRNKKTSFKEVCDNLLLVKAPLVSVHVITYNHEQYIAKAIDGVVQQKACFEFELIIGEDCSTDCTRKIVLEYQKKYPHMIRVLLSETNVGAHDNAMRVHAACRGKYVAFCEGDDYWHHPLKLQKQIDYLEHNPGVSLVHSDVDRYDTVKKIRYPDYHKERRKLYQHVNLLDSMIVNEYVVETCTAVVRRDLLEKIHEECKYEFSNNFLMGDVQTWIEIAQRSKVKYFDESLATRNLLPTSASNSNDIEKQTNFSHNALCLHLYYADKYGGDNAATLKKEIAGKRCNGLIINALILGKTKLAYEAFHVLRDSGAKIYFKSNMFYIATKEKLPSLILREILLLLYKFKRFLSGLILIRLMRNKILNIKG